MSDEEASTIPTGLKALDPQEMRRTWQPGHFRLTLQGRRKICSGLHNRKPNILGSTAPCDKPQLNQRLGNLAIQIGFNRFKKLGDGDGFGKIGLAAPFPDSLLIALHRKGGDGNHRDCLQFIVLL